MPPVPAPKRIPQWVARTTTPTAHYDNLVQYPRDRKSAANWINDMMVEVVGG
jgi:hypothetical protein